MIQWKLNKTLKVILLVFAALAGLAVFFFAVGLLDVYLENYNPHWIVKVLLVIGFLSLCYYLDTKGSDGDNEE